MYRRVELDFQRLATMVTRGLSDRAIGRVLDCSRETILNYRRRLGIASPWRASRRVGAMRRAGIRTRHAGLDRLWARLSLEQKTALLLQRPEANAEEVKGRKLKVGEERPELSTFNSQLSTSQCPQGD